MIVGLLHGSVFVNTRAHDFLEGNINSTMCMNEALTYGEAKLEGSRFGDSESIECMVEYFEMKTKPIFRDTSKTAFIKFGTPRDSDEKYGITRGALTLSRCVVLYVIMNIASLMRVLAVS